jgi:hypothetical protein
LPSSTPNTLGRTRSQSLGRRLTRIVLWIGGVAPAIFVLDLLGIPVREWIEELFDKLGEIPTWAIVTGVVLQSAQTKPGRRIAIQSWRSPGFQELRSSQRRPLDRG